MSERRRTPRPPPTTVGSLTPGAHFKMGDGEYELEGFTDVSAKIIQLERSRVGIGDGKTKEITYGVARLEIPKDTPVEH